MTIMYVHLPELFIANSEVTEIRIIQDKKVTKANKKPVKKITVTWNDFVQIWNDACSRNPEWIKLTERNSDLKKRFSSASKEFNTKEEWESIVRGMERDPFFSGKSGIYTKPKALTIFYKSRYYSFYEQGIDKGAKTIDDIVDELREIMKGIG